MQERGQCLVRLNQGSFITRPELHVIVRRPNERDEAGFLLFAANVGFAPDRPPIMDEVRDRMRKALWRGAGADWLDRYKIIVEVHPGMTLSYHPTMDVGIAMGIVFAHAAMGQDLPTHVEAPLGMLDDDGTVTCGISALIALGVRR